MLRPSFLETQTKSRKSATVNLKHIKNNSHYLLEETECVVEWTTLNNDQHIDWILRFWSKKDWIIFIKSDKISKISPKSIYVKKKHFRKLYMKEIGSVSSLLRQLHPDDKNSAKISFA